MPIKQIKQMENLKVRRGNDAVRDSFFTIDDEIKRKKIKFSRGEAVKDDLYLPFDKDRKVKRKEI